MTPDYSIFSRQDANHGPIFSDVHESLLSLYEGVQDGRLCVDGPSAHVWCGRPSGTRTITGMFRVHPLIIRLTVLDGWVVSGQ